MAIVAVTSVKGAPGVTTAALALASVWPAQRDVLLVEADPAGGDISARFGLPPEPSMVTLAASLRHQRGSSDSEALSSHSQALPGGLRVLIEPTSPVEAHSALDICADQLPDLATANGIDVVLDCGRDVPCPPREVGESRPSEAPVRRLLRRADLVLLVTGGSLADLSHVQARLAALRALNSALGLVVRPPLTWSTAEMEAELEVEILGTLPSDPTSADALAGRGPSRHLARLPLLRAAAALAGRIAARLPAGGDAVALAPPVDDGMGMTVPLASRPVPAQ